MILGQARYQHNSSMYEVDKLLELNDLLLELHLMILTISSGVAG